MHNQERQQRKMIGIVGALIVMIIGAILLAASALYHVDTDKHVSPASLDPVSIPPRQPIANAPARPTPPPLPTIVMPTPTAILPHVSDIVTTSADMPGDEDSSTTDDFPAQHADLATHLANELTCLQRDAQHVLALDARAATLAQEDTTPLPETGIIQLEDGVVQRVLIGTDMIANLQIEHVRCGETLVFGVPPLDWLPQGSRFGLGVSAKPTGLVIVVLKES